jgi:hypothetical protein
VLIGLISVGALAGGDGKDVDYVPPAGFAGHLWGETRAQFPTLEPQPLAVGAAFLRPVLTGTDYQCVSRLGGSITGGAGNAGGNADCDYQSTLMSLHHKHEGGGFYVMSEYRLGTQGFRFGDDGPVLFPVIYQFCANWDGIKPEKPPDFDTRNKFCGMRMLFDSETRAELAKLPEDHVTVYDRVVDVLLARFGKPPGFLKRGQVIIDVVGGEAEGPRERRYSVMRWCPARDRGLHTSCSASVVLSIDPETGQGTVFYSTPVLWEYAYARESSTFKDDPLFKTLHARK